MRKGDAHSNSGRLVALLAAVAEVTIFSAAIRAQTAIYADPAACAPCHPKIAETYSQSGMGRSFYRPSETNTPGAAYHHKPSDSYFTMLARNGVYYQRRHQIGPDGAEINVMEKRIDFVMGSGNHARAYLHKTERNTLIELPLGWYAENGGSLAMNPGYDRPDHDGFRRKIGYDCMFCHNGYPAIPAAHDQSFAEPVYADPMPQGIDCQRCHGPGLKHAEAAKTAGAKLEDIRKAIVNPARLSPERREEVCIQCHLETTSFPLPNSLQRYGRGPFAYRPGEPLSNDWLFFDHAPRTGNDSKFELVNAVYRMRQSACYLKSGNALGCTTCHNPHDAPRGEAATRQYDAACRKCHANLAASHTNKTGCADCHMPKRRTGDVVHAVATDHLIQRHKPAGDPLAEIAERHDTAYRGEVALYYPTALPPSPENALYLALAQVIDKSNLAAGIPRLAGAIARQPSARPEFYLALAEAHRNNGEPGKALPLYREAARRNPRSAFLLLKLGAALRHAGHLAEAAATLNRAIAATPNDAAIWHELGLTLQSQGKVAEAVKALEKAISLDPGLPEPHSNLGIVWLNTGDHTRAAAAFREAIRIQPDYVDARNNLANLLSAAGDTNQARRHFEIALKLRPADAATHYNFAMALGRARLFDEAQQQFEAAIQADPSHADARQRLAEMLMAKGQTQAALPHYRELVRIQPDSAAAQLGLGAALAMTGDITAGLPHLRKAAASQDPAIRDQATAILNQIRQ